MTGTNLQENKQPLSVEMLAKSVGQVHQTLAEIQKSLVQVGELRSDIGHVNQHQTEILKSLNQVQERQRIIELEQAAHEAHKVKVSDVDSRVRSLKADMANFETRLNTFDVNLALLSGSRDEFMKTASRIETALTSLTSRISGMEQRQSGVGRITAFFEKLSVPLIVAAVLYFGDASE